MQCPRCSGTFSQEVYETVLIDRCNSCQGIWLDTDELGKILQFEEKKFTPQFVRKAIRESFAGVPEKEVQSVELCPKCGKAMNPLNFSYSSGVIIDVCKEHGTWFDKDELEKIQAFHEEWELKKEDVREEYQATFQSIKKDYQQRYDQMRDRMRDKLYLRFFLFYWIDKLSHNFEKKTRD